MPSESDRAQVKFRRKCDTFRRYAGYILAAVFIVATALLMWRYHQVESEAAMIQRHSDELLDAMPVGLITCDEEARITFVNYEAHRILGWGRDELIGRYVYEILPDEAARKHIEGRKKYLEQIKNRRGNWMVTATIRNGRVFNRDGEVVRILIRMRAISFNGKVEGIATIAEITVPPDPQPFEKADEPKK